MYRVYNEFHLLVTYFSIYGQGNYFLSQTLSSGEMEVSQAQRFLEVQGFRPLNEDLNAAFSKVVNQLIPFLSPNYICTVGIKRPLKLWRRWQL